MEDWADAGKYTVGLPWYKTQHTAETNVLPTAEQPVPGKLINYQISSFAVNYRT